jgi:uncharacterized protein (TIGR03000 family)
MYSLVLMMALGNGAAAPSAPTLPDRIDTKSTFGDHGHRLNRGCHGCRGCWGCCGCYGGCHGCWGGYSCGGCWGGYGCCGCYGGGCYGGCYGGGCYGGCYGGYGCYGGCYGGSGCYGGCYGGSGCYGGYGVVYSSAASAGYYARASRPVQYETPAVVQTRDPNSAILVVNVPEDATLSLNDQPSHSTARVRKFVTPPLGQDGEYYYTLKAEANRDGKVLQTTKRVTVRAGQRSEVTLEFGPTGVARR